MEIERRFLIKSVPEELKRVMARAIRQYYVETEPENYRLREEIDLGDQSVEYWMTIKKGEGLVREEKNLKLSASQFQDLASGLTGKWLSKDRHIFEYQGYLLEVDNFLDHPLKVAEIEFTSVENAVNFTPPDWLGPEITGQPEYSNYSLWRQLNKL